MSCIQQGVQCYLHYSVLLPDSLFSIAICPLVIPHCSAVYLKYPPGDQTQLNKHLIIINIIIVPEKITGFFLLNSQNRLEVNQMSEWMLEMDI